MSPATVTEMLAAMRAGETSSEILTRQLLERVEAIDGHLHGYLEINPTALDEARAADARRRAGEEAPLLGVPLAVKDIVCVRGMRTTCGSRMLENYRPPFDATAIVRLRKAGAVMLGKTNLDEFAMGSSTENSGFGPSRNPWDPTRVPGGSSGGSAVAVAGGLAPAALGTDTGGSIRQPAGFCGITGLKPTYGRVSRYGLVAFASSLDQLGPMAWTAEDCARLLAVMAGPDPLDATSLRVDVPDYLALLSEGVKGLRLGVPREFMEGLDGTVARHVAAAIRTLEGLGAKVSEVGLPTLPHALEAYYIIAPAEASSNLARYDGTRYGLRTEAPDVARMFKATRHDGFGAEVKRRVLIGTYALSAGYYDAYYVKAQKARTLIRRDFERAFGEVDALVGPVTPHVAFPLGERVDDPVAMYQSDVYTIGVNLAGLPGLVVPCGFEAVADLPGGRDATRPFRPGQALLEPPPPSSVGPRLPVGLQLIGPALAEGRLLGIGHAFQQATSFHLQRPALEAPVR